MNTSIAYTTGIKTEERLIDFLRLNGYQIEKSSRRSNCELDIDCYWFNSPNLVNTPVSIKTQHTCLGTGNLAFELELTNRDGSKEDGWFRSGDASLYWIVVGNQLYAAWKRDISKYVLRHGWKRETHLSAKTVASQLRIGHKHVDAVVGLLPLNSLLNAKVLEWVCEVPDEVAYPNRSSKC
jgi:hypothetical protein